MMDVLEDFLHKAQICTRLDSDHQSQKLLDLLTLRPQKNTFMVRLYNVGYINETQLRLAIENRVWFSGNWPAFEKVMASFVCLCTQMNPWSLLESFDLYAIYLSDITIAFMNKKRGHILTKLLEDVLKQILPMAKQLDYLMLSKEMHHKPRLSFVAATLLKIFNSIRSQLGAEDTSEAIKKSAMLFISGKLCQTYFQLSNPLLCQNVFSNMNNAKLSFGTYHPNQQLQYRYYLAKFYIAKYEFVDAHGHLHWCLTHLPDNYFVDHSNVTKLLREYLPVCILLGRRPNFANLSRKFYSAPSKCPNFFAIYADLANAILSGNFSRLHDLLNNVHYASILKSNKFISSFCSKAFLITLRNLVKSIWIAQGKKMRLEYDVVRQGLSISLNGLELTSVSTIDSSPRRCSEAFPPLDDYAVENCLITLIDQNLLRGKVFPRLRVVSLAKSGVFPDICATYISKFGNGAEGLLNSADKWIGKV
ncbi:hypothetical protein OXX69_002595 [Metschnikowia pulcherrima]